MSLRAALVALLGLWLSGVHGARQPQYDLLLYGGHVIDARSGLNADLDLAIAEGRIAAVAPSIDSSLAREAVDVSGLYVVPGLVDIHTHVYAGTGEAGSYAGDNSVYPDGFTFRTGVTTVADAGGAGWRNFDDFKQRVIDRSRTRVLAFLNIVGHGMRGQAFEQHLPDMMAAPAADMARRYPDVIIGIKTAHYAGPEWTPVERAVEAGTLANLPVMVDFGPKRSTRPLSELLGTKLRPGDIYTHVYSGLRGELDSEGHVSEALRTGRSRGILFDVGHGAGSFLWRVAAPAIQEGFLPDSISTDLHVTSMNGGMKDQLNVMSKFIALGLPLEEVVRRATWNAASVIRRPDLGHLSVGAGADVAVLAIEQGEFGFIDVHGARLRGSKRLRCELTIRGGRIVYDLNGRGRPEWTTLPADY
jgi:dihydroorotase